MARAWRLAIEALVEVEKRGFSGRLALAQASSRLGERSVVVLRHSLRLVEETLRRRNAIDRLINYVLRPRSVRMLPARIKAFLRIYTYELKFSEEEREPAWLAKIGRRVLGWREVARVEEVLGGVANTDFEEILSGLEREERIALETFHPTWFVRYVLKLLGDEQGLKLLRANEKPPPTYVRINTLRGIDEGRVLTLLSDEGVKLEEENFSFVYKLVSSKRPLVRTKSYREGLIHLQDKASCFTVLAMSPQRGGYVLDVCAAPGSKTSFIAQLMGNEGKIVSIDLSKRRIGVFVREMARLGVEIAHPVLANARKPLPVARQADLVVVDPPCSSTGAFHKMPSAKWRIDERGVRYLSRIQWEILSQASQLVKPGGLLAYSTCSITVEENEEVVKKLLEESPCFELEPPAVDWGEPGLLGLEDARRLYPHLHECNGFFLALLRRTR